MSKNTEQQRLGKRAAFWNGFRKGVRDGAIFGVIVSIALVLLSVGGLL